MLFVALLWGCATYPVEVVKLPPDAGSIAATGDWDDVRASVLYAAGLIECSLVSESSPSEGVRQFRLRSIRGERVWVVLETAPPDSGATDAGGINRIRAICHVEPFGDAARESRFLRAFRQRLDALRGVESRPIS